jgi:hypothetical protein
MEDTYLAARLLVAALRPPRRTCKGQQPAVPGAVLHPASIYINQGGYRHTLSLFAVHAAAWSLAGCSTAPGTAGCCPLQVRRGGRKAATSKRAAR